MKLLFPNGEHAQVLITEGEQLIGCSPDADILLEQPGVREEHARLVREGNQLDIVALDPSASVQVNGLAVAGEARRASLKPGDLLEIAKVSARVVAIERIQPGAAPARREPIDDRSVTRVRLAIPKFVLRGVSGAAFGKTFPVAGTQTIGRQSDCDIAIASEEISRHHARVQPVPDGLMVEDLESSNGTYINGKRVQRGLLRPGEELRLDNIRFLLVAPGAGIPEVSSLAKTTETAPPPKPGRSLGWIAGGVLLLAAIGAAAYYLFM